MEEMKKGLVIPGLGDRFPDITVKTTHGIKHLPDDYSGKWMVLFSHPSDFTPVCTTEFIAFSKKAEKFKSLNAKLMVIIPPASSKAQIAERKEAIEKGKYKMKDW